MDHNKVPEGWKNEKLGEYITILSGFAFKSSKFTKGDGVPLIRIRDLLNQRTEVNYSGEYDEDYVVDKGDLLVGMDGDFTPFRWSGRRALMNQRICKVTTKDSKKVNQQFLYHLLSNELPGIQSRIPATTVKHLSTSDIRNIEERFPPISEQQKIAEILNTVDENIEETDKIIAECERVKKGLMQALLIKGVPGRHKKFKETELGMVPEEWDIRSLGEAAQFVNGRAFKPSDWTTDGIPIVRIQNLNGGEDYNYYVGEYEKKNIVRKGDLLFSWSGSRGTSFGPFIVQIEKGILNQHIFRVIPSSKIEMSFLYYFLKYLTYKIEGRAHGGAGLVHIKKSEIEKFKMVVPTISEQREIAETLSTFERRLEGEKARVTQLAILKQSLMQKLLSGEIRVKVD